MQQRWIWPIARRWVVYEHRVGAAYEYSVDWVALDSDWVKH